jgi:hypothetical protein
MEATDNAQPIASTPRRRMVATRYELFSRNGHLVLRCHSPDAKMDFTTWTCKRDCAA